MKMIYCITALVLCSCANATIGPQESAAANFGALPKNYQTVIRGYMSMPGRLKDPYTAVYRFEAPRKGFAQDGALAGGKRHYGWIVPTWINAKNSFGGYTGVQLYVMFLFEGKVSDITEMLANGMAGVAK
jgi:hypothetical protein